MKTLTLLMMTLTLVITSCKSTQNAEETAAKALEETVQKDDKIMEGFTQGVMKVSKAEGDCPFTIVTEKGISYDPINLENTYKKDGMKVWFRFQPLRRANRCNGASPINITEMQTDR